MPKQSAKPKPKKPENVAAKWSASGSWRVHVGARQMNALTMLKDAMSDPSDSDEQTKHKWDLAQALEDEVYRSFECPGREPVDQYRYISMRRYVSRIRTLYVNIKDTANRNPKLRDALVSGVIAPERLARMTHAEMFPRLHASTLHHKIAKKTTKRHRGMFRCRKRDCRSWDTDNFQMQIRSADEGMSVFIQCRQCGTRYRV
jgi:DNA-directed RNA polymerase subunit M/transcription elongation factor TFIIS